MMQEPDKVPTETTLKKFLRYFSLVMTLIYPVLGLILYFSRPDQIAAIDPTTKKIVGILLILYGLFRFYRTYKKSFGKNYDEDQEYNR